MIAAKNCFAYSLMSLAILALGACSEASDENNSAANAETATTAWDGHIADDKPFIEISNPKDFKGHSLVSFYHQAASGLSDRTEYETEAEYQKRRKDTVAKLAALPKPMAIMLPTYGFSLSYDADSQSMIFDPSKVAIVKAASGYPAAKAAYAKYSIDQLWVTDFETNTNVNVNFAHALISKKCDGDSVIRIPTKGSDAKNMIESESVKIVLIGSILPSIDMMKSYNVEDTGGPDFFVKTYPLKLDNVIAIDITKGILLLNKKC